MKTKHTKECDEAWKEARKAWETWIEAREALEEARKNCPACRGEMNGKTIQRK